MCVDVSSLSGVSGRGVLADHERPVAGHGHECLTQNLIVDSIAQFGATRPASDGTGGVDGIEQNNLAI